MQAPIHFLVIPKHRDGLTQLANAEERHEQILGHLLFVATKVAKQGTPVLPPNCVRRHGSFVRGMPEDDYLGGLPNPGPLGEQSGRQGGILSPTCGSTI